ncbi:MAG: hypothetical protein HC849_13840 [Oscillatoriales cyanobacterium RU_3_3]|nr:hypothetical protein [Microcoleus sp. SU_5_6]NJL68217.1 hypothetical protein [Microcoleus sp. SM1_3_4]NJM61045.1 hypothetical protein [Oscillatoriales cyanobacterium RU_3_3]NJR23066.1 hypothetical protein [Richelia sp. CSU_2_1]
MKAIETTGKIDDRGQLLLDRPLDIANYNRVRIIVLVPEETDINPDDDPIETVIEGIQQGFHEAITGQTLPLSQLWEGIDDN